MTRQYVSGNACGKGVSLSKCGTPLLGTHADRAGDARTKRADHSLDVSFAAGNSNQQWCSLNELTNASRGQLVRSTAASAQLSTTALALKASRRSRVLKPGSSVMHAQSGAAIAVPSDQTLMFWM